ncbi:FAD-binding and (Fe-S)-binding domain-containing protein, partial [Ramlibacter alkalitolerans]
MRGAASTRDSEIASALCAVLPARQVVADPLRRLAYGTDASFYRLTPEVVAVVESEADVQAVLRTARAHGRPVTFRAAGTSLSGQAVTDGVLALIGEGFATCEIADGAASVRLGPGMVGGDVNARLAPHGRKIGPDPASIATCKIGGIAANNASGMCCGTAQNSYHTLAAMRVVLADGTVLDTGDGASVAAFRRSHGELLAALARMGAETKADAALAARIRHKYRIKNTTGYSLNALVDFDDPVDILTHLMIGSEGTLGFISRITYDTVADDPCKASALVFFPTIEGACQAVLGLRQLQVSAVELLDRASLRSVQDKPGMPAVMRTLGDDAAALLVEVRAQTAPALQLRMDAALGVLAPLPTLEPAQFSTDPAVCESYWKVRKGTFPSVGAMRRTGTTVIIEDVAFPVESLAAATLDLQDAMRRHGYDEGIIFGHALEGNLHFVFTQDFSDAAEIERYARFMEDVCTLVVDKYDGSLKAEHGTGRNMAPFVEREWGPQATQLMRRIKALFDPGTLLNPGVIIDDDPQAHLKNLKPMPAAEEMVDRCIECGFCEPLCPSHKLTLSPRQRITSWRERSRLHAAGESTAEIDTAFGPLGLDTCAGCGLCATACPVGIDTGSLVRLLRERRTGPVKRAAARCTADHYDTFACASRL